MCSCNSCDGSGWLRYWQRRIGNPDGYHEESEPCRCNPKAESVEEHEDRECVRDVTLAP